MIFQKYEITNNTEAHPYVDEFGNLYYETPIFGEEFRGGIGKMLIFSYMTP